MPRYIKTPSPMNRVYGWQPSLPDLRDHYFGASIVPSSIPLTVDLRPKCPAVYDQGDLSSCTANAIAGAIALDHSEEKLGAIVPSRLFIYYYERALEGTIASDNGASLRDGISVVYKIGAPDEVLWPYDPSKVTTKPSAEAYAGAAQHKVTVYQKLNQNLNMMKTALAQNTPFVFGFMVYNEFEDKYCAETGILTMPGRHSSCYGGHAVTAVGYNDSKVAVNGCPPGYMIVRNSWGSNWGAAGYFFMPFQYIANWHLALDFWVIKTVV